MIDEGLRIYVKQLEQMIEELKRIIEQQQKEIHDLKKENLILREEVKRLKGKVNTHFYHRYKPNESPKKETQRGRKKGHEGSTRALPVDVDEKKVLEIKTCPHCDSETSSLKEIRKRMVEDIEIVRHYIRRQYELKGSYCRRCKKKIFPKPNDILPNCRIGINTFLYACELKYKNRMSIGLIQEDLERNFCIKLSQATLVNGNRKIAKALGSKFEELKTALKNGKSVYADDTGWRIEGQKRYLWKFVSENVVVTVIDNRRSHNVIEEMLGEGFDGTLISDFHTAFSPLGYKKQKCLVHLIRHTKQLIDDHPGRKKIHSLHKSIKNILNDALEFKKGQPPPDIARKTKKKFEKRIRRIAHRYQNVEFCRAFTKLLLGYTNELFTFLEEDVDWNNNAAERAIRSDVVRRKISGGNRSAQGAKDYEIIASVMDTCKLRKENFSEIVMKALSDQLPTAK